MHKDLKICESVKTNGCEENFITSDSYVKDSIKDVTPTTCNDKNWKEYYSTPTASRKALLFAGVSAIIWLIFYFSENILYLTFPITLIAVCFHEICHFAAARLCGVPCYSINIGVGPAWKVFSGSSDNRTSTPFVLRAFPLAAYVILDQEKLRISSDYKKIFVFGAGVAGNFLLFGLFINAYYHIYPNISGITAPVVGHVIPGSKAEKAGFQTGDRIATIDQIPIFDFWNDDFRSLLPLSYNNGAVVKVGIVRDKAPMNIEWRFDSETYGPSEIDNPRYLGFWPEENWTIKAVFEPAFTSLQSGDRILAFQYGSREILTDSENSTALFHYAFRLQRFDTSKFDEIMDYYEYPSNEHPIKKDSFIASLGSKYTISRDGKIIKASVPAVCFPDADIEVSDANPTYWSPFSLLQSTIHHPLSLWSVWRKCRMSAFYLKVILVDIYQYYTGGFLKYSRSESKNTVNIVKQKPGLFIRFIALINLFIAIMNILPIPPLDGYHIAQIVSNRILGAPVMTVVNRVFFPAGLLLVCYMVIVNIFFWLRAAILPFTG